MKEKFLRSSLWVVFERAGSSVIALAIFLLLARFVGPADFGLVALAALVTELTRVVLLSGVVQMLVQRTAWSDDYATTSFWTFLILSLLAAACFAVLGLALGNLFGLLMAVLSITIVFDASKSVHEAKLRREFRYRSIATRTLLARTISGLIGILCVIAGFGVWGLVVHRLLDVGVQSAMVWRIEKWKPSWHFSLKDARDVFITSSKIGLSDNVSQIGSRLPEMLIGWVINATAVGFFRISARGISLMRIGFIAPIQSTALSAFSRMPNLAGIGRAYLRLASACAMVSFPMHFGLAVVAKDFVQVTLGDEWMVSGDIMQVLAIGGAFTSMQAMTQPALIAAGRPRLALISSLAVVMFSLLSLVPTMPYGVVAVAVGLGVAALAGLIVSIWTLHRGLQVSVGKIIATSSRPLLASILMSGIVLAVQSGLLTDVAPLVRMGISVLVGAIAYSGLIWFLDRAGVDQLRQDLESIRIKRSDTSTETI